MFEMYLSSSSSYHYQNVHRLLFRGRRSPYLLLSTQIPSPLQLCVSHRCLPDLMGFLAVVALNLHKAVNACEDDGGVTVLKVYMDGAQGSRVLRYMVEEKWRRDGDSGGGRLWELIKVKYTT
ncbi:hypothetical protein QVD17_20501 [Tagetes erecta]|uniref:Uncharacterized protein n=1 Tax=Tagetes erecta TaxID=13708 RepID=A0AAD8KSY6_TARER|nr:hypothetical protein QVD17_20501 [Tagetes erecta]